MNTSLLLLRRSVSSKRLTLASLTQRALVLLNPTNNLSSNHHFVDTHVNNFSTYNNDCAIKGISDLKLRRGFDSGGVLNVKSGVELSNIAAAVDDFSDEDPKREGAGKGDEGLEISKLGISTQIVDALATKGITKLFPIQVQYGFKICCFCYVCVILIGCYEARFMWDCFDCRLCSVVAMDVFVSWIVGVTVLLSFRLKLSGISYLEDFVRGN